MVLLKGKTRVPSEVWTGSTNISEGGIHGQTNVGHWVRNKDVAAQFLAYWNLLSGDPGPAAGEDRTTALRKNKELRTAVEALHATPRGVRGRRAWDHADLQSAQRTRHARDVRTHGR